MRASIRKLYYILNVLKIRSRCKNIKVSLSSEIKSPNLLEGPCKIGSNSYLSGRLGKYSYIGRNCRLNADIGKFCSISENVRTVEGSHPIDIVSMSPVFYSKEKQCGVAFISEQFYSDMVYADEVSKRACIIGNDVWIGEGVMLKGGITIGDGACVAMGAVVTHDVLPYSVVAGVPAKEIKKRFDQETIKLLQDSKWWDKPEEWIKAHLNDFLDIELFKEEVTKK